jgi:PST family polysaccharide transporter
VLFLTVINSGLVATPAALLQREFRQRARTLIDQVAIWIGALVSIALALLGSGAMGLAVGRLLGVTASCFLMYRAAPNGFRFGWSPPEVPRLLRFGLPLAGVSIVVFAVGFLDQIVTSRTIGAVGLGLYVLATNLASWPITVISTPLRSVAPALFARLQHDLPLMGRTFTSVAGLLAAVTLPMCLGLAGASKPVILLVYGQAWAPAAEPLLWLGIAVGIRPFFELAYDYLVIAGGTQRLFGLQIVWVGTLIPALLLGSRWGLAGIAASSAVVSLGVVTPLHLFLLRRRGVHLAELATQLWLPGSLSCIFGVVAWRISAASESAWVAVGATACLGICVVAGLLWTRRTDLRQLHALHAVKPATDF